MFDRISVVNLKIVKSRSFETVCFTGALKFDGKTIATLSSEGNGGPTDISAKPGCEAALKEAEAWAKSLPPEKGQTMDLPMDLEFAVNIIVYEEMNKLELKSQFKKVVRSGGIIRDGKITTFKVNIDKSADERRRFLAFVEKTYPTAVILANMSEEEGFKMFMEAVK